SGDRHGGRDRGCEQAGSDHGAQRVDLLAGLRQQHEAQSIRTGALSFGLYDAVSRRSDFYRVPERGSNQGRRSGAGADRGDRDVKRIGDALTPERFAEIAPELLALAASFTLELEPFAAQFALEAHLLALCVHPGLM